MHLSSSVSHFYKHMCVDVITLAQAGHGLQDTLSKGSYGVLDTGAQAKHILEVRFLDQQLPVWGELW